MCDGACPSVWCVSKLLLMLLYHTKNSPVQRLFESKKCECPVTFRRQCHLPQCLDSFHALFRASFPLTHQSDIFTQYIHVRSHCSSVVVLYSTPCHWLTPECSPSPPSQDSTKKHPSR